MARISAPAVITRPLGIHRVVAIGDTHDAPDLAKDRFERIGAWVRQRRPDRVVQGGDLLTVQSLCGHEGNHTARGRRKPTFQQDIRSGRVALDAFRSGLGTFRCPLHVTLGNHEDGRYSKFQDEHPELGTMLADEMELMLRDFGWTWSRYGELHDVEGVWLTHAPFNAAGKTVCGNNAEASIARDSVRDLVFAHTHRARVHTVPKIGGQVTVLNLGCALPTGHVEEYAQHGMTGWTWGVWELSILRGRIVGYTHVPLIELGC